MAQRAADRKRMVAAMRARGDPLAAEFDNAIDRAEAAAQVARTCGDYPLLAFGELNLYALFVERAMTLVKPDGMVGLLTPSGIASDKTAARFFKGVATGGRLRALYDFENRRTRYNAPPFFPDVDSRFKFCAFVASPTPTDDPAMCAFFLQDISELDNPDRRFPLTAEDFSRVNPNTGTAPIFRSRRAAELTTAIYSRLPVLVDRSSGGGVKAWPVKYTRMFDMSNDSDLFRTREELEEQEGAYPVGGNRFDSATGEWLPLYEGKMVQAFDHRAASIFVNPENQHRPAQPKPATLDQHQNADWLPNPQFWVPVSECGWTSRPDWVLGFKEITAPTNVRTFIASLLPTVGFGNKVPILKPEADGRAEWLLAANFNAIILDFVARQKVQGQTLNLFIVEQFPVVPPDRYEAIRFGPKTAGEIVREAVLELTYTAYDMAPFARDMGYVDKAGKAKPPFTWDEARRLHLRAKLDAVFFHLYGVTDRDDIRYIYSTFPIVERPGKRSLWVLPLPRPLPRLDERAGGGQAGCGDQSVNADHYCSCKPCAAADCGLATVCRAHKQGRRFRLPSWGTGRYACSLPVHPSRQAKAGRNACPTWQATRNAVNSEFSECSEHSVPSVDSADSVPSADSEFSEEFCCPRYLHDGQSGRRAFVNLRREGEREEKAFFAKQSHYVF